MLNSTYDVMVSVIKYHNQINNVLLADTKTEDEYIMTSENNQMDELINVLEPFKLTTILLGGEKYVTSSIAGRYKKINNSV